MKYLLLLGLMVSAFQLKGETLSRYTNVKFSEADVNQLSIKTLNESFRMDSFLPEAEFKRINLYSNISIIKLINGNNEETLTPSGRLFFISVNTSEKIALSYQPSTKSIYGFLHTQSEKYHFNSDVSNNYKLDIHTENKHDSFDCLNDDLNQWELEFNDIKPDNLTKTVKTNANNNRGSTVYQAHVSVDTDNELMFKKFQNNSTTAINWIENLFLNLNVIYESEVDMRVVIASTFLRIDLTPNGNPDFNSDPETFNNGLSSFASYWANNYTHIDRVTSMLISGKGISSGGFSGVAYVNAYCNNSFSYSFNRLGANFSATSGALFIGHELGHNFGSSHTHCEQLANGGTDFVDHCYNTAQNGCFAGTTSCPASGNGTMMSYCHAPASGFDGTGPATGPPSSPNCNTSTDVHALIATKLSGRIQNNYPSCIKDLGYDFYTIFEDGFE